MKKFKQMGGVILAVGIILFGLIAFLFIDIREKARGNQIEADITKSAGKATLVYYTWDEEESYMSPIIESFNAINPDIQVEMHVIVSEEFDKEIVRLIKAGEKIDLIGIRGISQMAKYQSEGLITDITKDILESDVDITPYGNMYNNIIISGKYYGMPTRSTCWALVYNKDIFDQKGEPYPGQLTWEEYGKLADKLTTKGANKTVWGGYIPTWAFNFAGIQKSNYLYDDDQTYQRKSLELLNQFMNIDKSHMGVSEIEENKEKWLDIFEQGRAAMMPMGEWFVGMIMDDENKGLSKVNWDLAPMPIYSDMNPGTTWGQYQFTGITSTCEDKDAAFQFLKYVGGEEGAKIYAEYGMLSAYSNENVRKVYQEAVGEKNVGVFFDAFRIQEIPVFDRYDDINQLFTNLAKEYLSGKRTLNETMEEFDRERKKIIENR